MSDVRALLIECRAVLRGAPADPAIDALLPRLDPAIAALGGDAAPMSQPPATQVALAWQAAARNLKRSHPAIYDELNERVLEILGARQAQEPTEALLRLDDELTNVRREQSRLLAQLAETKAEQTRLQAALTALYEALAEARPELADADPQSLALARIAALACEERAPEATTPEVAASGPDPDRSLLRDVSQGRREFSKEQRDWVVGEALGLTAWSLTPMELLDKGDAWLAQLLLDKSSQTA